MTQHPFVLLRGLVREAAHWGSFADELRAGFPDTKVLTPDLLGNGVHHQAASPTTVRGMVDALRAELDLSSPIRLFAVSLGGMVATEWASTYPHEIECMVLANSSLRGLSPFWSRLRPAVYPRLFSSALEAELLARERRILSVVSNRVEVHDEVAQEWTDIQAARPVSRMNLLRQVLAGARYRAPSTPPNVPTLVMLGDGDQLVSPSCSRAIARAFSAELVVHPTAGHDITLDAGPWVVEQLLAWMGRQA